MSKGYAVAVVGATGNVGRAMLSALAESSIPVKEVFALASKRSKGKQVTFKDQETLEVGCLDEFDFSRADIALFSAGGDVSCVYAPLAASKGCVVIDNTSYFRMDPEIPLIVPEVNLDCLGQYKNKNIIANPNCSTIQLLVAIAPIHQAFKIKRVVVATYQSTSGAGKAAMDELYAQTKGKFTTVPVPNAQQKVFEKQIAFNCIPKIGDITDQGFTTEELKMINETRKILDQGIEVSVTCVRVPVFIGHSESVYLECEKEIDLESVQDLLFEADGVQLIDQSAIVTPVEVVKESGVFVCRVRADLFSKNALSMWVVADNLGKGAALNSVQIAEHLIKQFL